MESSGDDQSVRFFGLLFVFHSEGLDWPYSFFIIFSLFLVSSSLIPKFNKLVFWFIIKLTFSYIFIIMFCNFFFMYFFQLFMLLVFCMKKVCHGWKRCVPIPEQPFRCLDFIKKKSCKHTYYVLNTHMNLFYICSERH